MFMGLSLRRVHPRSSVSRSSLYFIPLRKIVLILTMVIGLWKNKISIFSCCSIMSWGGNRWGVWSMLRLSCFKGCSRLILVNELLVAYLWTQNWISGQLSVGVYLRVVTIRICNSFDRLHYRKHQTMLYHHTILLILLFLFTQCGK